MRRFSAFILLLLFACDESGDKPIEASPTTRALEVGERPKAVLDMSMNDDRAGLEAYVRDASKSAGGRAHAAVTLFSLRLSRDSDETDEVAALLEALPTDQRAAVVSTLEMLLLAKYAAKPAGRHIAAGTHALLEAKLPSKKAALVEALVAWSKAEVEEGHAQAARFIAAWGTDADKRAALEKLRRHLKAADSDAWADRTRKNLRDANRAARMDVSEAVMRAQFEKYRREFKERVNAAIKQLDPDGASLEPGDEGHVHVGKVGVAGGAVADADATVAKEAGRLRACYTAGLRSNPELRGSVTLTIELSAAGKIASIGGGGGENIGPIVPCLKAVLASARFAAAEGGSAVLTVPVTFTKEPP